MTPDYAHRRRIAVAAAITVIGVPAVLLLDRGGDATSGSVVNSVSVNSVVTEADPPAEPAPSQPSVTDPMGTSPAGFLDGTVVPLVDDPATIAIPRLPDAVDGDATFSRSIPQPMSCQVAADVGAPFGAAVTVTNVDNSRSVQCINNVGGSDPSASVVLHVDAFLEIGDLTDAPVPVQLTWSS